MLRPMRRIELIAVRHTQIQPNVEKRYSGHCLDGLTEVGKEQACSVALQLAKYKIRRLYCSDLPRAKETAHAITLHHVELAPVQDPRLRELTLGSADGRVRLEFQAEHPGEKYNTSSRCFDFTEFGGETREQLISRTREALRDIAERHGSITPPYPVVCVVGHGTQWRVMFEELNIQHKLEQGSYHLFTYPVLP